VGKCRPMHLFAVNIKCMQICVGVPSEKVYLPRIPASIFPDCTCSHFLAYFPTTILSQRPGTSVLCRAAGSQSQSQLERDSMRLAGCVPAKPSRLCYGRKRRIIIRTADCSRIGLNVQCINILYFRGIPG